MVSSLRERISASKPTCERVTVPEWGVELELRGITVKQRADLLQYADTGDGEPDMVRFGPMLLVVAAHDPETGEAAFSADDVDWLAEQPAGVVDRLVGDAMRVSGLRDAR